MGRYDFSAQLVHRSATRLLEAGRMRAPPPWYDAIADYPPSGRSIVRPCQRRGSGPGSENTPRKGNRPSRNLFRPLPIEYEEDFLRKEFFKEHPWELARPRIVVEDSGDDTKWWDWSKGINQRSGGRGVDGESVIQRQLYLMREKHMSKAQAYDVARREFYAYRHQQEISQRIAREEALSVGAYFGPTMQDIGVQLEDEMYARWKQEAIKRGKELQQRQASGGLSTTSGSESESDDIVEEDAAMEDEGLNDPTAMNVPVADEGLPADAVHPRRVEAGDVLPRNRFTGL